MFLSHCLVCFYIRHGKRPFWQLYGMSVQKPKVAEVVEPVACGKTLLSASQTWLSFLILSSLGWATLGNSLPYLQSRENTVSLSAWLWWLEEERWHSRPFSLVSLLPSTSCDVLPAVILPPTLLWPNHTVGSKGLCHSQDKLSLVWFPSAVSAT